jgi:arylsulfatase A-like enzyme
MKALERRVGDLPKHIHTYDRSLRAIRTDRYKYIRGSDGSRELYDLDNDPGETTDIANRCEDVVSNLDSELDEWLESFTFAHHTDTVSMNDDTKARLEDLGYLQ